MLARYKSARRLCLFMSLNKKRGKKRQNRKKKKIVGGVKYGLEFVDDGLVKICLGLVSVSYLMRVLERTIGGPFCRLVDDVQ